jgi:hypothetical protein
MPNFSWGGNQFSREEPEDLLTNLDLSQLTLFLVINPKYLGKNNNFYHFFIINI